MKAIVYTKYGPPDVLRLEEVEKPTLGDDEVLVKIHATSINAMDWHRMRGKPTFARFLLGSYFKPKHTILGADIAGRVEAVGKNVTQFQPGDDVFTCIGYGGFAEYAVARESKLVRKPANISFEAVAALPIAGITALQAVRDHGHVQPGQKVLVNGASGGVGTFAVQIARAFRAEVTAVCSTRNVEMARGIGADYVIDYTKEDFTRSGKQYDVIIDIAANHSIREYKRVLTPNGIRVGTGFSTLSRLLRNWAMGWVATKTSGRKFVQFTARAYVKDMVVLKEMLEAGKIAPVLDKCYPLSETAEAMRYFGVEHARGKIIINMQGTCPGTRQ